MKKFCVIGDPNNKPRFSSNIITSSLNKAAQELNLFDENGIQIKYDGVCNSHGDRVDAFICTYELYFPDIIVNNAGGKPIIGVSLHNWSNILESNHKGKSSYFSLGVDMDYYPVTPKTQYLDQFVFGVYSESLVRGGIEEILKAFSHYKGDKTVKLIIKDRNATELFSSYVSSIRNHYEVDIEYINEHWDKKDQIIDFASKIDVYINTNRCSTFNMPVLEMMAMEKPCIITPYSGPADFCLDEFNCLCPSFNKEDIRCRINFLSNIGCRNFFFESGYTKIPIWGSTYIDSLFSKMETLKNNEELRRSLGKNARKTAENMSWKKSANQLSYIINEFFS